ncbi:uncharacterized protein [Cardiocondyla obscurior]|uniref:uncharacterized protein n=1 Tax=Cardiocondyla obscurior TaxID=286306 RepID=UPI00396571DA
MPDRIRFIVQKRTSLKLQITNLSNLFEKGTLSNATLKLRLARLTTLYNAFEEYQDELALLDPNDVHTTEFDQIQDRFYTLAGKIDESLNATGLDNASSSGSNNENQHPASRNGKFDIRFTGRALLDTGATANFITETIAKRLKLQTEKHKLPINTINSTGTVSKGIVRIMIQSIHNDFSKELTCLTIPVISDLIPSDTFPRESIKIPANLKLADPEFYVPAAIDLFLGSGATMSLFSVGQVNLSQDRRDLYLQKTRLGWVVAGETFERNKPHTSTCHLTNLENLITKFWTIEEIPIDKPISKEEADCETFFTKTVSRNHDGRYIVHLPFRESNKQLGESRSIAIKRLLTLERKLNMNLTLKHEYTQVIEEYKNLKHISKVEDIDDNGFYMPHHVVIKESSNTTKVRVVFDASAKTSNGQSLNDILMVGPTIQDTLFLHLIRFRTYEYVILADIEKMYRQVLVNEEDRRY